MFDFSSELCRSSYNFREKAYFVPQIVWELLQIQNLQKNLLRNPNFPPKNYVTFIRKEF